MLERREGRKGNAKEKWHEGNTEGRKERGGKIGRKENKRYVEGRRK